MELLTDLLRTGRIAEVALTLIVLEAVLLVWLARRRGGVDGAAHLDRPGRHVAGQSSGMPWGMLAHLAAGGFLMLALRAALVGSGAVTIALCLTGALIAHLLDLALRLRS